MYILKLLANRSQYGRVKEGKKNVMKFSWAYIDAHDVPVMIKYVIFLC